MSSVWQMAAATPSFVRINIHSVITSGSLPSSKRRKKFLIFHVLVSLGYKLFKLILFITGFFVGFFSTYVICSLYLSDQIHGKAAEHKDKVLHCHFILFDRLTH